MATKRSNALQLFVYMSRTRALGTSAFLQHAQSTTLSLTGTGPAKAAARKRPDVPAGQHCDITLPLASILGGVWEQSVQTSWYIVRCRSKHNIHGPKGQDGIGRRWAHREVCRKIVCSERRNDSVCDRHIIDNRPIITPDHHAPGSNPYRSTRYRETFPILLRPPEISTSPSQLQIRLPSSRFPPTISMTSSSQWLGTPPACAPLCAQRPVAHASASPMPTNAPQTRLARNELATCTRPVRAHTSGHASRTRSSCAARSDACAHVPTRAAIRSGPPSAASSASACVCADVSCATGELGNEND